MPAMPVLPARPARPATPYALLELQTGNMVGWYRTEREALEEVVDSIARYGRESVATLALAHFAGGDVQPIAMGEELAARALAAVRRKPQKAPPATIPKQPTQLRT